METRTNQLSQEVVSGVTCDKNVAKTQQLEILQRMTGCSTWQFHLKKKSVCCSSDIFTICRGKKEDRTLSLRQILARLYPPSRKEFLQKINVVPASLAIAQGSIESAWGKSRFVRLANNVFGHWTWGEIGIIPARREEGKTHKIRIFSTLQKSVDAYMLNLNRHVAYEDFRKQRNMAIGEGRKFSGHDAAGTMLKYSELGEKYVKILQKVIKDNRLLYYDNL